MQTPTWRDFSTKYLGPGESQLHNSVNLEWQSQSPGGNGGRTALTFFFRKPNQSNLLLRCLWQNFARHRTQYQGSLFTVHCTRCTEHWTLCTVHCALNIVHCTLCTEHCTLCTDHWALYTLHSAVKWTKYWVPKSVYTRGPVYALIIFLFHSEPRSTQCVINWFKKPISYISTRAITPYYYFCLFHNV